MIEMLPDMPPGVTGVRVSGRLSGQELREVRPTLEKSLKSGEIRIVEVIDSDYQASGPAGWSRISSSAWARSCRTIRHSGASRSSRTRSVPRGLAESSEEPGKSGRSMR